MTFILIRTIILEILPRELIFNYVIYLLNNIKRDEVVRDL